MVVLSMVFGIRTPYNEAKKQKLKKLPHFYQQKCGSLGFDEAGAYFFLFFFFAFG